MLGTQLDVNEDVDDELDLLDGDADDPEPALDNGRGPALNLYRYLSMLLQELVEAMSDALPEVQEEP